MAGEGSHGGDPATGKLPRDGLDPDLQLMWQREEGGDWLVARRMGGQLECWEGTPEKSRSLTGYRHHGLSGEHHTEETNPQQLRF